MSDRKTFMVEGGRLIFRNFAGRESMYNTRGERNFAVELDEQVAQQMAADGWNVKFPEPGGEDAEITRAPHISVALRFDILPPKIIMITSTARTPLKEDTVELLDWADISNADLIANGSEWSVGGKSGIKAYLKSLYVTIEEDELDRKYAAQEQEMRG
jgi:hypothetical protein